MIEDCIKLQISVIYFTPGITKFSRKIKSILRPKILYIIGSIFYRAIVYDDF